MPTIGYIPIQKITSKKRAETARERERPCHGAPSAYGGVYCELVMAMP